MALCWNSLDDKIYCACVNDSSNVTVIDGSSNEVVATIDDGGYAPFAFCHDSLNNKIYCANEGSGTVSVIGGTNDSLIKIIDVGHQPLAFGWNYSQDRIYVADYGSASVSILRDSIVIPGVNEGQPTISLFDGQCDVSMVVLRTTQLRVRFDHDSDRSDLFDLSGRTVMDLVSGNNDVSHLAPGVYFLHLGRKTAKVVLF
jgi:YVTN family beta-propeller protein